MLLVLTLAAAVPALPPRLATLPLNSCTDACAMPVRSRYRLDPQIADTPDMKRTALATDGSECSVVGGRVCTHKPRTIFTTDFTD